MIWWKDVVRFKPQKWDAAYSLTQKSINQSTNQLINNEERKKEGKKVIKKERKKERKQTPDNMRV